jgi:predicted nucleic acid-binding protein
MRKLIVDTCVFINAFKKDSEYRIESTKFLNEMQSRDQLITMPAHGLFEVICSFRRVTEHDKKFIPLNLAPGIYPIEAIHIDKEFICNHINVEIPYIKAGDHIFIAAAKVGNYQLITWDKGMYSTAKKAGVQVFTPTEYLNAYPFN